MDWAHRTRYRRTGAFSGRARRPMRNPVCRSLASRSFVLVEGAPNIADFQKQTFLSPFFGFNVFSLNLWIGVFHRGRARDNCPPYVNNKHDDNATTFTVAEKFSLLHREGKSIRVVRKVLSSYCRKTDFYQKKNREHFSCTHKLYTSNTY